MARASTNFPGLEEVLQDLMDQRRKTPAAQRLPFPPSKADIEAASRKGPQSEKFTPAGKASRIPPSQGGGIFNVTPGSGAAFARKAIGTGLAVAPFVGSAWDFGADLGNRVNEAAGRGVRTDEGFVGGPRGRRMLREKEQGNVFGGGLPSIEEITGTKPAAQPAGVISVEPAKVAPFTPPELVGQPSSELTEEQEGQQIAADSFSPTVRFEMPATPPAEEQPVEILGDPDTIVQEDPNDLFAQQLRVIAEMPPHTLEREQVNPADEQTIAAASKNRVERPAPPKETFGRKLKRFVVAGSGPVDFTRLDRQESDLYQAQNRLTEPEQFGANVAAGNVRDTKQFNRAAQMAEYGTGGVHPMTKFSLDLLAGERKNFLEGQRESTGRRETHANQVDLIGRSAAAAKLSPEHMKAQALWNMAEKNPDVFASFIEQQTGYQIPPEVIKVMMESRSKNNAENERFQMVLNMLPNIAGGAARKPLNTSSIAK